jgi:signal transduction histidine kinase
MPIQRVPLPVSDPFELAPPTDITTEGRLRTLLRASQAVVEQLDLPAVLRRVVEAAVDLVGARFGALGVIAPNGSLEQFIHVGVDDGTAERIGRLPEGHGLLGALIDDPVPIRLDHLQDDPRFIGFPSGHPSMESLLGVPVRVRGEVYGNLYLAHQASGAFSDEDQELLGALAATAGIAIDNARLFDETQRRQRWSAASAEISAALLSERSDDSLALLADRFAATADAELVCVIVPAGDDIFAVETARGGLAGQVAGYTFPAEASVSGRAFDSGQPFLVDDGGGTRGSSDSALVFGPSMVIPLSGAGGPYGVLTASRMPGGPRFTASDLEMASDFAGQASVALELARGRADRARLAVLSDRNRIARDLHDRVIQRVFAAGMALQAIGGTTTDLVLRRRISDEIGALDAAIVEIRTAIFALTDQADPDRPSVRHRIIDLLTELGALFEHTPRLVFSGPIDLLTPGEMADDLVSVVREGLTNVLRHAQAAETVVNVTVVAETITIDISDDGIGCSGAKRCSGIANLAARAGRWRGTLSLSDRQPHGTRLRWSACLAGEDAEASPR